MKEAQQNRDGWINSYVSVAVYKSERQQELEGVMMS